MKLQDKKKLEIVPGIPDKYNYMDSLSMNGWAWEFVRRNEKYIEAFIKLEKAVKERVRIDGRNKILSEIIEVAYPFGLLIGRGSSTVRETHRENFLILKLPHFKGYKAGINKYFGGSHHEVVIPRPEIRYCDIMGSLVFRPQIKDYEIHKSFNDLLNQKTTLKLSTGSNTVEITPTIDRGEHAFYIAVSKKANIADLKEYLFDDIAIILKKDEPRRVRQDKWKYYLIVYDLKQKFNDELSYDQIASILIVAYREGATKYFNDTRNINNWYKNATSLINSDFTKHLKFVIQ